MKLKNLSRKAQMGLLSLAVSATLFTACTGAKKTASKTVPKSYSTVAGKATMTNAEARLIYVDLYKNIAIREMERTGIPASIKLSQGILESNSGRSELSSKYNNHFGIKCHSEWTGERYYKEDDDFDPVTKQLVKSCFRAYKNSEESFIAHSEFIRDPRKVNRYGFLFQLDKRDYVSWANGLERAGYATATDYSEKLIRIIEDMQLSQYDQMSSGDLVSNTGKNNNKPRTDGGFDTPTFNNGNNSGNNNNSSNSNSSAVMEGERNNVKFIKVNGGLTLEQVAGRYDVSIKKLKEYNEEAGEPNRTLPDGTILYTQSKRNKWHGEDKYYRIQQCETMYDVAQKFGIKLSKLYSKNEMREGDQPQIGEKIVIRRGLFQRVDMPALRDTFGEWRKCHPDLPITQPTTGQPTTAGTKPTPTTPRPNGEFPFEITPGNQPATSYPPSSQSGYPQSSYPPSSQPSTYPSTESSYPSSGTTSYPSSGTTTYPSSGTTTYPSTDAPSYPSYPSYPSTQPTTRPSTQPTTQPTMRPSQPQTRPTTPTKPAPAVQYYTVAQGETLWAISRKFSLTVDQLKQLNGLADNIIKPGQQLRVK